MANLYFKVFFSESTGIELKKTHLSAALETHGITVLLMKDVLIGSYPCITGSTVHVQAKYPSEGEDDTGYSKLCYIWNKVSLKYCQSKDVPFLILYHVSSFHLTRISQHYYCQNETVQFGTLVFPNLFSSYTTLPNVYVHFYHDESTMEIRWTEEEEYKLLILYKFIRNITCEVLESSTKIFLDLLHPPILFWREERIKLFPPYLYYVSHRTLETFFLKAPVIGKANVLHLEIPSHKVSEEIINCLHFRCRKMQISYGCIKNCTVSPPTDPVVELPDFSCNYLIDAILKRNFSIAEQVRTHSLNVNNIFHSMQNFEVLREALIDVLSFIDSGRLFDFSQALTSQYQYREEFLEANNFAYFIIPEKSFMIRRVVITPTRTLYFSPEVMLENRILRKFNPDYFLKVCFRDDDFSRLSNCAQYADETIFDNAIRFSMINGIQIANRKYEFLAWSVSQLRDHSVWMYACDDKGSSASDIRTWMGNFSSIRSVSMYSARMGQCFSQSIDTVSIPLDGNRLRLEEDIERGENPITMRPYCFSDGIGKISTPLAKKVRDALGRDRHCSAFQIRYGGFKGMLVEDPTLIDADIVFRESMRKFDAPNAMTLEIIKVSSPSTLKLNRPFINILNQLYIENHIFLRLQEDALHTLTDMLLQEDKAAEYLTARCRNVIFEYKNLSASGIALTSEPFFRSLLMTLHRYEIGKIKRKANIPIDPSQGRNMMSVLDETGQLNYGQVFVQYTTDVLSGETTTGTTTVIGTVVVTKNPCMHPGDVRKFQAVDIPALHHIVDCIVFPQNGHRPHPDELSGSDLDGDECAVLWHKDLIFEGENCEAADFPCPDPLSVSNLDIIEVKDIIDFLIKYIKNDMVGSIATSHLAFADEINIFCWRCIILAYKYSRAIDFPKHGVPVEDIFRSNKFPDFMEKHYKKTYKSRRALGKMFRICKDFETENLHSTFSSHPIEVDPALKYPGWEKYEQKAIECRDKYNQFLSSVFQRYGIAEEAETFSGAFSHLHCHFQERQDKAEVEKVILASIKTLCKNMKKEFFLEFGEDLDSVVISLYQKASAWYVVTYREENPMYLSFPWIVSNVLVNVYQKRSFSISVPCHMPVIQRFDQLIHQAADNNALTLLPEVASSSISRYNLNCEDKIIQRALQVMIQWAFDMKIIRDSTSEVNKGFLYTSSFIDLFLHVALLENYIIEKESVSLQGLKEKSKSSSDLCLAFLRFCMTLRFHNKQEVDNIVPFKIAQHNKLANLAMTSYHSLAITGNFDTLCLDENHERCLEMKTQYIDSNVFPQLPIPSHHLKEVEEILMRLSGAKIVHLREHTQNAKILVSAYGTKISLCELKQLIRKMPRILNANLRVIERKEKIKEYVRDGGSKTCHLFSTL